MNRSPTKFKGPRKEGSFIGNIFILLIAAFFGLLLTRAGGYICRSRDVFPQVQGYLGPRSLLPVTWDWRWSGEAQNACKLTRFSRHNLHRLLENTSIVIAGDSQARLLLLSLARLILTLEEQESLLTLKRHSDFHLKRHNTEVDFLWAPFPGNVTTSILSMVNHSVCPDVLIISTGLWHMLWVANATDFLAHLEVLRAELRRLKNTTACQSKHAMERAAQATSPADKHSFRKLMTGPHFLWLGLPNLLNQKLNTARKREVMTPRLVQEYEAAAATSGLFQEGLCRKVDLARLTRGCGSACTRDGMHYNNATYDAALQIIMCSVSVPAR